MTQGPNVKRLIAHKMVKDLTPPGSSIGTVAAAIVQGGIGPAAKAATEWVEQALAVVRQAAEPNPWKTATDEDIAGHILSKIPKGAAEKLREQAAP